MPLLQKNTKKNRYTFIFIFLTFLFLLTGKTLYAHSLGQSYVYLQIYDDKLAGRFEITLQDINRIVAKTTGNAQITKANLHERIDEVHDIYFNNVTFKNDLDKLPIQFTKIDTLSLGRKGAVFVQLDFTLIENSPIPDAIDVAYSVMFDFNSEHLAFLVIEHHWNANIFNNESKVSLFFNADERMKRLDIINYSVFHGFIGVVKLGIKHIWKGIDHILFLVALILPAAMLRRENIWQPVVEFRPAFMYVVKIVTLFTIAHSITLSLAALNVVSLPSRLVESVIAISIAVAALDILYPIFHRKIGWAVLVFGLFHGFGFASVLSHLGVLGEHMALSLFGFNLGVEAGQVVVIILLFPVLFLIRNYNFFPKFIMKYGAISLILIASLWFMERAVLERPIRKIIKVSLAKLFT